MICQYELEFENGLSNSKASLPSEWGCHDLRRQCPRSPSPRPSPGGRGGPLGNIPPRIRHLDSLCWREIEAIPPVRKEDGPVCRSPSEHTGKVIKIEPLELPQNFYEKPVECEIRFSTNAVWRFHVEGRRPAANFNNSFWFPSLRIDFKDSQEKGFWAFDFGNKSGWEKVFYEL